MNGFTCVLGSPRKLENNDVKMTSLEIAQDEIELQTWIPYIFYKGNLSM